MNISTIFGWVHNYYLGQLARSRMDIGKTGTKKKPPVQCTVASFSAKKRLSARRRHFISAQDRRQLVEHAIDILVAVDTAE